jgi:hypothetical protein
VGKASSTKKVARLASSGGKTKVRPNRSLTFPLILTVVIGLGLALIVFARTSTPSAADTPPTLSDHWHTAYGIYACGEWLPPIQDQNDSVDGVPWGIHSHGDGVIHIHPFTSAAAGKNADLGEFFKTAGIKMSDTKLELPEGLGTFEEGETKCGDEDGSLKVLVWDDANSGGDPAVFITDFGNIRFTQDRMAMTIAFVTDDTDLSSLKPPSVPTLDNLSDVDPDSQVSVGGTNVPDTTVPSDATAVPSETTVAGSESTTPAETTSAPTTSG